MNPAWHDVRLKHSLLLVVSLYKKYRYNNLINYQSIRRANRLAICTKLQPPF